MRAFFSFRADIDCTVYHFYLQSKHSATVGSNNCLSTGGNMQQTWVAGGQPSAATNWVELKGERDGEKTQSRRMYVAHQHNHTEESNFH